jgi:hypothetical protein
MCQTARRRMEGLWREGCERIESCQERWRGRKRKGTMLATLKARPALMTMTMTVEDVERTRCVSNTKHTDIHHCKTSAFSIDSSHPVLETFEAHRLPFKQ